MKDENKQTVLLTTPILFDDLLITRLTFDLLHINQGWNEEKHDYAYTNRSEYSAEDIIDFFEQFRYFTVEWVLGQNKEPIKVKGRAYFRYHWETSDSEGELVRIVLDIPLKASGEGIIVTVFKP